MNKLSHLLVGAAAGAAVILTTPALAGGEPARETVEYLKSLGA